MVSTVRKRLLLISNSTQHGRGYLDHVESEIRDLVGPVRRVLFAPFAMYDLEENDCPVVGLREGGVLRIQDGVVKLKGSSAARVFGRGMTPVEVQPGEEIDSLLAAPPERSQ